jgi:membrane protein
MASDALGSATARPAETASWLDRAKEVWQTLYQAGVAWSKDNAMRLSAAVAMYTILSLSPLLVITIKVLAVVFGDEAASGYVTRQVEEFLGPTGAEAVRGMITQTVQPGAGILATAISFGILLFTASGVFNEIRASLNQVWEIQPPPKAPWWRTIRERFLSIGMVFVIGFLLLVSLAITTVLTVASEYIVGGPGWVATVIDLIVSTLVVAVLFGLIFRFLPDVRLPWSDVLFGAVVTALLFKIGQYVLALYFTYGSTASAYGAAGSFVVVLLWVYYSCWILFFGAELIQVRLQRQGRPIQHPEPSDQQPGPR